MAKTVLENAIQYIVSVEVVLGMQILCERLTSAEVSVELAMSVIIVMDELAAAGGLLEGGDDGIRFLTEHSFEL